MVIEIKDTVEKRKDKLWAKESVNALIHYNKMVKNPSTKLRNIYGHYLALLVIYSILCPITLGLSFFLDFPVFCIFLLVICLFCWLVAIFIFSILKRGASRLLKNRGDAILTVDEKGLEIAKANHPVNRYGWDHIALVKVFSYSVVVYTKDKSAICFSKEFQDPILSAIKEQGKSELCYLS